MVHLLGTEQKLKNRPLGSVNIREINIEDIASISITYVSNFTSGSKVAPTLRMKCLKNFSADSQIPLKLGEPGRIKYQMSILELISVPTTGPITSYRGTNDRCERELCLLFVLLGFFLTGFNDTLCVLCSL